MSFDDWCQNFTEADVCRLLNTSLLSVQKTWNEVVHFGNWMKHSDPLRNRCGGCMNHKQTFLQNPQVPQLSSNRPSVTNITSTGITTIWATIVPLQNLEIILSFLRKMYYYNHSYCRDPQSTPSRILPPGDRWHCSCRSTYLKTLAPTINVTTCPPNHCQSLKFLINSNRCEILVGDETRSRKVDVQEEGWWPLL